MTIYVDVLIVLNIYVNYFLLKATSRLTHTKLYTSRCIISSVIGSIFSLTILLPSINSFFSLLLKLLASGIIVLIAFRYENFKAYLKMLLFFFGVNFIFAGVILAIWLMFKPSFIQFNNSYFYVDFSLLTLIITTIIAYFAVSLIRYIFDRRSMINKKYDVIFSVLKKTVSMDAIADTGNTLTDIFTGKPVVICSSDRMPISDELRGILSSNNIEEIQKYLISHKEIKGLRLIPYSTLNSNGTLAVFSPDKIIIKEQKTGEVKEVSALVGINTQDNSMYNAIFNPNLLL